MKHLSITAQKQLALSLLDWHGGQSSGLYAVGSCMLADANCRCIYDPARSQEDGETHMERAISELRNLRRDANFPDAVTPEAERECNALADKLTAQFRPRCLAKS